MKKFKKGKSHLWKFLRKKFLSRAKNEFRFEIWIETTRELIRTKSKIDQFILRSYSASLHQAHVTQDSLSDDVRSESPGKDHNILSLRIQIKIYLISTLKDSTISTFEENSERLWVSTVLLIRPWNKRILIGFKKNLASWGTFHVHLKFKINNGHSDH